MSVGENVVVPVREMHRLDETRLAAYLREHLEGFEDGMRLAQFEGGQSNPTYFIQAGGREYVLRKKPPGTLLPSAHNVAREYEVMTALDKAGFVAPKTYLMCRDESIVGTEFYVMEKVRGRVLRDVLLPELDPGERTALYNSFIDTLAAMHNVDFEAVGLGEFGKHGDYCARQIHRWSKQYVASKTDDIPEMDRLMAWLPENIPAEDATAAAVVHGDFRIENAIVHPTEPRIVAILDWELSTLGNPLSDLGYCCMGYRADIASTGSSLHDADWQALGIPDEAAFLARYCEKTGRDRVEHWNFYIAYSLFRVAAIIQGVYKRGLDGNSSNPRAIEFADHCRRRAAQGWAIANGEG